MSGDPSAPPDTLTALIAKWRERQKKHSDYAACHTASQAIYGESMGRSREIKMCADELEAALAASHALIETGYTTLIKLSRILTDQLVRIVGAGGIRRADRCN